MHFDDIQGIRIIFAEHTAWPNPANLFIIPDEKGFSMIDVGCGGAPRPKYLIEGLEYWDLHIQDLHTVLLSHAHPDHMGAMGWILQKVRPRVFIHHLDVDSALNPEKLAETFDIPLAKRCLNASENAEKSQNFELLNFFKDFGCAMSAALNVEGIGEGHVFHLGDFAFEVIHTPGHSPGSICIYEPENKTMFTGDVLIPNHWYQMMLGVFQDATKHIQSMKLLSEMEIDTLCPGHEPVLRGSAVQNEFQIHFDRYYEIESSLTDILSDSKGMTLWEIYYALSERIMGSGEYQPGFGAIATIRGFLNKLCFEGIIVHEEGSKWRAF